MTSEPDGAEPAVDAIGDDPQLRLFRGPRAIEVSDAPPREVRTIIAQLRVSAVAAPIIAGGVPWLLTLAPNPFPASVAIVASVVAVLLGVGLAVLAILLGRGSEWARRLLTWPHGEESVLDVAVMGGWWMLARDRLRTRRARAWFHHRTRQRATRRRGGPR